MSINIKNIKNENQIIKLIDENNKMIGNVSLKEGLNMAKKKKLNLISILNKQKEIIYKITNIDQYKYKIQKKKSKLKKTRKNSIIKEIRLRINIAPSDLKIKISKIKKIIIKGNKVKIKLIFKGREIIHEEIGVKIMTDIITTISKFSHIEKSLKKDGKSIYIIVSPVKKK